MNLRQVLFKLQLLGQRIVGVPAADSEDFVRMLEYIDIAQQTGWFGAENVQWESTREDLRVNNAAGEAVLTGPARSYPIIGLGETSTDSDDVVTVEKYNEDGTTSSIAPFSIIDGSQLAQYRRNLLGSGGSRLGIQLEHPPCAIYGGAVHFPEIFKEGREAYGGQIFIPHYKPPQRVTRETDLDAYFIEVDKPDYVYFEAATYMIRSGFVKQGNANDFAARALSLLEKMKQVNLSKNRQVRYADDAPGIYG